MLIRLSFLAALLAVLAAAPAPLSAQATDTLPHPTRWDTFHLVLLRSGPQAQARTPEAAQAMRDHIQYQLRLQEKGTAVAAGGLVPEAGSDLVGITLLRVTTLEEARAIAEADPAVRFGRFRAEVRPWYVPADRVR